MNIDKFGDANVFEWTHKYLVKVLTTGKEPILKSNQQNLINAFRNIKRGDFVPNESLEIAYQDCEIKLPYGAILDKPTVIAEMLSILDPKIGGRYLDIGTGSGWVAALLSIAVGESGEVYSLERIQFLAEIAKNNLKKYPDLRNIKILFNNGSRGMSSHAPYSGIHVSVAHESVPEEILSQLDIHGKLVIPTTANDIRVIERVNEHQYTEKIMPGYFLQHSVEGVE